MTGNILIVAGEASGDLHGSNLIKALKELDPSLVFYGVGSHKMKSEGFEAVEDSKNIAVVGISEVFLKLRAIWSAFNKLKKTLDERKPDVVVLIDFPDFNLSFAREVKKRAIPIVYYISPQIWAWRKRRIKKIARLIDKMLVVFPFEKDLYRDAGVDAEYVGHPLVDVVSCGLSKNDVLSEFGMENAPTVALMPGSRKDEIVRLLPPMLETAYLLKRKIKDIQFLVPLAETIEYTLAEDAISACKKRHGGGAPPVKIVKNRLYEALKASDAAVVASGTATLETALMGVPMVIIYKVSLVTAVIGRILVAVDHIGLPNIIAGRKVVPELIQRDARPSSIARYLMDFLNSNYERDRIISGLNEVRERLGKINASKKAAEGIYEIVKGVGQ